MTSLTPDIAGEHTFGVEDLVSKVIVKAPETPARFDISLLDVTPAEIDLGESADTSISITNTGDLAGDYEISLLVDDQPFQQVVTL